MPKIVMSWRTVRMVGILLALLVSIVPGKPSVAHDAQQLTTPVALDICGNGVGTSAITGRVTRAADGLGTRGVNVTARSIYGDFIDSALVDASGIYTLTDLAAGRYILDATPVSSDARGLTQQFYDGQATAATFTPVEVGEAATVAGIDFALASGAVLTGTITDATTDAPIPSVRVSVFVPGELFAITSAVTNNSGMYITNRGLPPGDYIVEFRALSGGYRTEYYEDQPDLNSATPLVVTTDELITLNATLTPADDAPELGVITGRLTAADTGDPIVGEVRAVSMALNPNDTRDDYLANVDNGGYYTITLPAGDYKIVAGPNRLFSTNPDYKYARRFLGGSGDFAGGTTVTVQANQAITGQNIALPLGTRISGKVVSANGNVPLVDVRVNLFPGSRYSTQDQSVDASTDDAGNFLLPAVATGAYTFTTFSAFSAGCRFLDASITPINVVAPNALAPLDITLEQGAVIAGRVTRADSGDGLSGAVIGVSRTANSAEPYTYGFTAETGYYRTPALAPDSYIVSFFKMGFAVQYYDGKSSGANADVVQIQSGDVRVAVDGALDLAPQQGPGLYLPSIAGP